MSKMWQCVMFLLIIASSDCKPLDSSENQQLAKDCGKDKATKHAETVKLFGAGVKAADLGQFPWAVAMRSPPNNSAMCTGSLISRRHVLTAAHCFVEGHDLEACKNHKQAMRKSILVHKSINVLAGEVDVAAPVEFSQGVWVKVKMNSFKLHPLYDCRIYDVAIMELDEDIPANKITPICLPPAKMQAADKFQVAGWGMAFKDQTKASSSYAPDELMWGDIDRRSNCDYSKKTLEKTICTNEAQVDVCHGDSGGPLMQKKDNKYYLMGITSASTECSKVLRSVDKYKVSHGLAKIEKTLPGAIFTDVRKVLPWICEQTKVCYPISK